MRKFTMSVRRFSAVVLPFTSSFIQSPAVSPRTADPAADRASRQAGAGQAMTPHDYAKAAVRMSRTYWW
ncbi:hypothetical protein HF908_22615 (plasmid) [Ralstonia pseudosolanacearum]|uniref:Uncharacterized protein n=1 Tax=Ralstonia solanacearum TaxID=305 RepID=A0AA92QDB7_RALSL|nr:hypothetical protein [Ralstonia pseudosolanacearum]QOK94211.1 hypothetical protein HF908_22615 [Ralstonia pseudosolanacearum]QOK99090.1 hypothetical protein HF909_22250 [Ralstonia pseudosolanacearum]